MNVGDRVYYEQNGPDDTGTVTQVVEGLDGGITVKWDADGEVDCYNSADLRPVR